MTGTQAALFVVALLALIGGINALVWTSILRRRRARTTLDTTALTDEFRSTGEATVMGPSRCRFHGSAAHPHRAAVGLLVLTAKRVAFRSAQWPAGNLDLPFASVTTVSQQGWFRGKGQAGQQHLVFKTPDDEVGFIVYDDESAWFEAAKRLAAGAVPVAHVAS